jgi:hypothetical protein
MAAPTYTGPPGTRQGDRYERAAGTSGLTIANMGEME